MPRHGKRYKELKEKAPADVLEPGAAIEFLKSASNAKFDEAMELGLRMDLDAKKSDLSVRGTVGLPHGTGKSVCVLVFATGEAAAAAKEAGADHVGFEELIEKVKGGWTDFDVSVATPGAMKEVRKLGRTLGPRGLMPNPTTGTVTDDTAAAVKQSKAGRVEFRMDRHSNINVAFGRVSFPAEALAENLQAVVAAVRAEKPAGVKGTYIKNCTISTTMGPGVRVLLRDE